MIFPNGNSDTIIFLDIDDTVASLRSEFAYGSITKLDPVVCTALANMAEAAQLKVVVASLRHIDAGSRDFANLKSLFNEAGLGSQHLHHDQLAIKARQEGKVQSKWPSIEGWLARHPEVTNYVIIDDERCYIDAEKTQIHPNQLLIEGREGMQSKDLEKLQKMLGMDWEKMMRRARVEHQDYCPLEPVQYVLELEHYHAARNARIKSRHDLC